MLSTLKLKYACCSVLPSGNTQRSSRLRYSSTIIQFISLTCMCFVDSPVPLTSVLHKGIIGITIKPALARLGGSDHGVPGGASMFAGMLIRRAVAAQGHAAFLARSQMHPACADLYAFTTFKTRRVFHLSNGGKMCTAFVSHNITSSLNTREQTGLPSRLRRLQR